MPKSNRGGSFGRRSGTVTVIDEPVRRSSIRTAKIVFHVLWPVIGLLAATVLASRWHPILALFAGIGIGLVTALIAAALVAIWPVLRTLWWWAPESPSPWLSWPDGWNWPTTPPCRTGSALSSPSPASPSRSGLSGSPSSRWPGA